ncbi:MAG: dipicolinate synthase subunit A N-terminal domain-containing protein [Agathobaculum sp.]|jgi:hypothetical protein|uniref:dipicolinate synthase subunit A N-terminal domain-containing protein n=1 Tax=Agathobaculum sp. TaxID=2048138 RepID=UPI003D944A60
MNKSASLAVVGGDVRQAYLAGLLHADGHEVRTYALERHPIEGCIPLTDLRVGFSGVQAIILPLPVQHGDMMLNAPLSNAPHPLAGILDAVPAGTLTLAGAVPFWVHARAVQNELRLTDYLSRDDLAIRNAVPVSLAKNAAVWEAQRPAGCHRSRQAFCLRTAGSPAIPAPQAANIPPARRKTYRFLYFCAG